VTRIVVDASAIVNHLIRPDLDAGLGAWIANGSGPFCIPHSCDAEALSSVRSLTLRGVITKARASATLRLFREFPASRFVLDPLLVRAFSLRDNFSAYDALYVALAESLEAPLLTADLRLADATRRFTTVEVLAA